MNTVTNILLPVFVLGIICVSPPVGGVLFLIWGAWLGWAWWRSPQERRELRWFVLLWAASLALLAWGFVSLLRALNV